MKKCIKEVIEEKEEKVKEIKNDIEEYIKYLKKIEEYKDVELGNILSMFNLPKMGLKKEDKT